MKVSEALRDAMALIEDESRWCRDYLALSSTDSPCSPSDADAVRRCADGALSCAIPFSSGALYHQCARHLQDAAFALFDGRGFITVNDAIGHAAVMECYREAIGRAEAEESR